MKKKLYFTIEFGFDSTGEIKDGNKYVTMYIIRKNDLVKLDQLDLLNEENTTGRIEQYLEDGGNNINEFELILL